VAEICKLYGGGGHAGAAGFNCEKLPFIKKEI
jgi:nanoRNase/pAp phosphatase (c-di-AMP/oligoRNAs hydrolase)